MESPESSYVSSPEAPRRSGTNNKYPVSDSDEKEKPFYVRFLVSNSAAGSVIGKGGSTITEFQSESGARIQLSRTQEFFPGTSDRIIMVSGGFDEIMQAMELILAKLLSEAHHAEEDEDVDARSKVRIIVPNSSCGGIIGKGGATIKSFIEDSQAGIKISPQDHNFMGLNDRLVTLTGSLEEQMRAIFLILSKLAEDAHYPQQSVNAPFSYAGVNLSGSPYGYFAPPGRGGPYNSPNYGPNGNGGKFQNNKEDRSNSVTIGVSDDHIGLVVGRGGRNLQEITQVSGARIKISDRGFHGWYDREKGDNHRVTCRNTFSREYDQAKGCICYRELSNWFPCSRLLVISPFLVLCVV